MATERIKDQANYTTPLNTDVIAIEDLTADATKKITRQNFLKGTPLPANTVDTQAITDDSVTAAKIDWASTGANGGIWWEELGRTTLASAGDTITVSALPARRYLKLYATVWSTGGAINPRLQFNGDTGANYYERSAANGAGDGTAASQAHIGLTASANAGLRLVEVMVANIASQEKIVIGHVTESGVAGAANTTQRADFGGKWANATVQISSVTITNIAAGDFAADSQLIVLGHD